MRTAILTFDDGYRSHYDFVFPELNRRGISGTFYITEEWAEAGSGRAAGRLLEFSTYSDIAKMSAGGMDIGWHGTHHNYGLNRYSDSEMDEAVGGLVNRWSSKGLPRPASVALTGFHHADMERFGGFFPLVRVGRDVGGRYSKGEAEGRGSHVSRGAGGYVPCHWVAGSNFGSDYKESVDTLEEGRVGVFCFHGFDGGHLDVDRRDFVSFLDYAIAQGIQFRTMRHLVPKRFDVVDECPYRSPRVVVDAFADKVSGKTFCDLGCSRGDVMSFFEDHAKYVRGLELEAARVEVCCSRGFEAIKGSYFGEWPEADVYYSWPCLVGQHSPQLARMAKERGKSIILIGDKKFKDEAPTIRSIAEEHGAEVLDVRFNEGKGRRMFGEFAATYLDFSE